MAARHRQANDRPSESREWLIERIDSWIETYKKSMLTPVILRTVAEHQPVDTSDIAERIADVTGWSLTERGLYRTLKRLADSRMLASEDVPAPRTGAKRKSFSLTDLGAEFLAEVSGQLIELPDR